MHVLEQMGQKIVEQNPGMPFNEVGMALGVAWGKLSDAQKAKYTTGITVENREKFLGVMGSLKTGAFACACVRACVPSCLPACVCSRLHVCERVTGGKSALTSLLYISILLTTQQE
jgi:hypothetical protein